MEQTPFKDLTVDEIARAAGLSRTAFYFYYRDKYDVLMAVADDVADALYGEAERWWHGKGEPEALIRAALEGAAVVYELHASLLRAVTEVSTYDEELAQFWRSLVQRFIDATAEHLRLEREAGAIQEVDPTAAAESLVWMTERCLYIYVLQERRPAGEVIDSLTKLWVAALYGT